MTETYDSSHVTEDIYDLYKSIHPYGYAGLSREEFFSYFGVIRDAAARFNADPRKGRRFERAYFYLSQMKRLKTGVS